MPKTEPIDFTQPVISVESSYWHRFMSGDGTESCITCGAEFTLVNLGDGRGRYTTNSGEQPITCTGRTDLAHGIERHCEGFTGRGCVASQETGTCEHTEHECNCVQCS